MTGLDGPMAELVQSLVTFPGAARLTTSAGLTFGG
jgi:hypothetical protein